MMLIDPNLCEFEDSYVSDHGIELWFSAPAEWAESRVTKGFNYIVDFSTVKLEICPGGILMSLWASSMVGDTENDLDFVELMLDFDYGMETVFDLLEKIGGSNEKGN